MESDEEFSKRIERLRRLQEYYDRLGAALSVELTPPAYSVREIPSVPNSEIVDISEIEIGDTIVVWSQFGRPRNERVSVVKHHPGAVVILRSGRTLEEVVPAGTSVMRKKRRGRA